MRRYNLPPSHKHELQPHFFGVILVFYGHADGGGLGEWLSAQLEGAVNVPALCSGQELELLVTGEYKMAMATTTHFIV